MSYDVVRQLENTLVFLKENGDFGDAYEDLKVQLRDARHAYRLDRESSDPVEGVAAPESIVVTTNGDL